MRESDIKSVRVIKSVRKERLVWAMDFELKREPTTPGEILREEFLEPLGITQGELAKHIGCDVKVINRIVNGATGVTAEMAIKLGAALRTSPDLWLNAQQAVSLYRASRDIDPPTVLPKLKLAMA